MGIYHIYVQYSALVLMSYKLAFPWSARILEKPFGKGFRPRVLGQCASVRNLWIPDEGICVPGSGSLAWCPCSFSEQLQPTLAIYLPSTIWMVRPAKCGTKCHSIRSPNSMFAGSLDLRLRNVWTNRERFFQIKCKILSFKERWSLCQGTKGLAYGRITLSLPQEWVCFGFPLVLHSCCRIGGGFIYFCLAPFGSIGFSPAQNSLIVVWRS